MQQLVERGACNVSNSQLLRKLFPFAFLLAVAHTVMHIYIQRELENCATFTFRMTLAKMDRFQRCGLITIRSTPRAQTSAERQHNRIAEWFLQCKLAMQLWSEFTRYFFDNPVNPDFGLWTPGSGRWSGSKPKFNPWVPVPCLTPPRNFVKIRSQLFQLSDGQTNRQTNTQTNRPN